MSNPDHDLDRDAVWDLVDQARPPHASPLFARNVLREIRLAGHRPAPWWKRFLTAKPLAATGLAAAAAVAILVSLQGNDPASDPGMAQTPTEDSPALTAIHDDLEQELLMAVAEDPSLFSDEQLLALLY